MDSPQGMWLEAEARVQASVDAEARDEAYEVYLAEAARCRLEDRTGSVRLRLRSGVTLTGRLDGRAGVLGQLSLTSPDGQALLVPGTAVVAMSGSRAALRDEADETDPSRVTQWLRDAWAIGERIRVLDSSGTWWTGAIVFVGADHVELEDATGHVVVPLWSVDAWAY